MIEHCSESARQLAERGASLLWGFGWCEGAVDYAKLRKLFEHAMGVPFVAVHYVNTHLEFQDSIPEGFTQHISEPVQDKGRLRQVGVDEAIVGLLLQAKVE
eukprot:RCo049752